MKLEIQYHRLQSKVAKMKSDFAEKTKELRKENRALKKKIYDLGNRLDTALTALDREKESAKGWKKEKNELLAEIRDLQLAISRKDAHITNLKRACKANADDIWKLDDYDRVKAQLREYVRRH